MTVLLLEDQPLIAIDTDAMLKRAGFVSIVHFASVAQALVWLSSTLPDLAITEIALQGVPCTALAEQFVRENVPFLVYSGANRSFVEERILREAPWLSKPSETELLEQTVGRLLGP